MTHVTIITLPVELSRDPEMADVCNPHGIRWGFAAHVVVEKADGSRLQHVQGFVASFEDYAVADANDLLERVQAHVKKGGDLRPECWFDIDPAYGSAAYIAGGYEQMQAQREKEAG